jgi:hypothetical protein
VSTLWGCLRSLRARSALDGVGVRAYGRLGPRLTAHRFRLGQGSGSGAAATVESAFLLNRLAVPHPNRLTEIIPLISGNCTR